MLLRPAVIAAAMTSTSGKWLTLVLAILLAAVHVTAKEMRFLHLSPRSRWLSFAGGISVAFVFVHVLPDLARAQRSFEPAANALVGYVEHHVYLLALLGLVLFFGVEHMALRSSHSEQTGSGVFWVHIGSFAGYNAVIGYLLLRGEHGGSNLLLFGVAIATHFLVNDFGLRRHHAARYDRVGRWVLASMIVTGWLVAMLTQIHPAAVSAVYAFLAGAIVLNVLKEELPAQHGSSFAAFATGAAAYTALLIII